VHLSRPASVLRRAFIAASTAWAAALPASVYAGTRAHVSPVIALLVGGVYVIGSVVCHQLPERSFYLWGAQLPVCARCTGIYGGAAFASLLSYALMVRLKADATNIPYVAGFSRTSLRWRRQLARLKPDATNVARSMLLIAALPTIATLIYEWTTGVTPSNTIRALTGFPLGAAVAVIVLSAADIRVN
jgi:uncharacterized membrane protein